MTDQRMRLEKLGHVKVAHSIQAIGMLKSKLLNHPPWPAEFVGAWEEIKAEEERRAAEEAELFKTKLRSTEIATEEQVSWPCMPVAGLGSLLSRAGCLTVPSSPWQAW